MPSVPQDEPMHEETISGHHTADNETEGACAAPMAGQPGSSTAGGVGESGTADAPILIGAGHNPSVSYKFTKKFQICTGSSIFQYGKLPENYKPAFTQPDMCGMMATPLQIIDPNNISWFMTRKEFQELPKYSFATRCGIKVRPLGYRLPFQTNQTAASDANSQSLIQVAWATGLNHKFTTIHATMAYAADLVTPSNTVGNGQNIEQTLYKFHGATIGVPRLLNYSCNIVQQSYSAKADNENNYAPHLLKTMTVANIIDVRGKHIHNFEYKYKIAPLKLGRTTTPLMQVGVNRSDVSQISFAARKSGVDTDKAPYTHMVDQRIIGRADSVSHMAEIEFTYDHILEKSAVVRIDPTMGHVSDLAPPCVYFGCMPVQANSPYAATASFVPAVVYWEVETDLDVTVMTDFIGSNSDDGPWQFQYDPRCIRDMDKDGYLQKDNEAYFAEGRRLFRVRSLYPGSTGGYSLTNATLDPYTSAPPNTPDDDDPDVKEAATFEHHIDLPGPVTRSRSAAKATEQMEVETPSVVKKKKGLFK